MLQSIPKKVKNSNLELISDSRFYHAKHTFLKEFFLFFLSSQEMLIEKVHMGSCSPLARSPATHVLGI